MAHQMMKYALRGDDLANMTDRLRDRRFEQIFALVSRVPRFKGNGPEDQPRTVPSRIVARAH